MDLSSSSEEISSLERTEKCKALPPCEIVFVNQSSEQYEKKKKKKSQSPVLSLTLLLLDSVEIH